MGALGAKAFWCGSGQRGRETLRVSQETPTSMIDRVKGALRRYLKSWSAKPTSVSVPASLVDEDLSQVSGGSQTSAARQYLRNQHRHEL